MGPDSREYPRCRQREQDRSGNQRRVACSSRSLLANHPPPFWLVKYSLQSAGLVLIFCEACTRGVFIVAFPVLLRLALLPGSPTGHVPVLLQRSLSFVTEMETDIAIPTSGSLASTPLFESETRSVTLHRSQQLFDSPPVLSTELWGACVEALWRVSMVLPYKTAEWDGLSSRILIWRSIAGAERTRVGEWARRETLTNLAIEA